MTQRILVPIDGSPKAEAAIPYLTAFILGEARVPWNFLYGDLDLWKAT